MLSIVKSIQTGDFEIQLQKQTVKLKRVYHVEVLNSSLPTGLNIDLSRFWLRKRDAESYYQQIARSLGGGV